MVVFFFQAEDGIRDGRVTGVQTCALPISGGETPTLSRMGGADFAKTKARVKAAVREIAQELVVLYQRRITSEGHAFPVDSTWQREFEEDRKSTRLNSSHPSISYAVFCLKK